MNHLEKILKKSFDDLEPLSKRWQKEFRLHKHTMGLVDEYAGDVSGKAILDIGCGLGILVYAFSLMGGYSEGVDKNVLIEWGLEGIEEMWNKRKLKIKINDFFSEPYLENSYDVIISENVFEHLPYLQKEFLEKIYGMLRPGGILFLATPNLATFLKRFRMFLGKSPYWDTEDFFMKKQPFGHFREFTKEELEKMAELSNFKVINIEMANVYFRRSWILNPRKWPALLCRILSFFLPNGRDVLYLIAKKPILC